jgi:hypothetical protein
MLDEKDEVIAADIKPPEDDLRGDIAKAMKEVEAKEAATETPAPKEGKPRDEAGKFAAKPVEIQTTAQTQTPPSTPNDPKQVAPPAAPVAPVAPRGWSPASKAAFDQLPDSIKADVVKRENEVNQGFAKYSGLDKHVQDFEAAGVKLPDAIAAYREAENQLSRNFPNGVENLCQQFNIHPVALAQHILQKYGQQAPQQGQQRQQPAIDPQLRQYITNLENRVNGIESQAKAQAQNAVETDINKFIADPSNKFVDNVVDQMVLLIKGAKAEGKPLSLKDAYDAACWQNPETRQLLINEQTNATSKSAVEKASKAANQARAAAASVTGSPIHGVSPDGGSSRSLRDDIKAAFDQSMGRV